MWIKCLWHEQRFHKSSVCGISRSGRVRQGEVVSCNRAPSRTHTHTHTHTSRGPDGVVAAMVAKLELEGGAAKSLTIGRQGTEGVYVAYVR